MTKSVEFMFSEIISRLERIERLSSAFSLNQGPMLAVMKDGFRAVVDPSSLDLGQWLIRNGEWEAHYTSIFCKLLRSTDVVLDVGANQGWYSLTAANLISKSGWGNTAKVIAIEPNSNLCRMVLLSLYANGWRSFCDVLNIAVSDKSETLKLAILENMLGSSTTRRYSGAMANQGIITEVEVPAFSVDQLISDNIISSPTLIKADIEGWEGAMLYGAQNLLSTAKDLRLMLEWSSQMDGTPINRRQAGELLANMGYKAFLTTSGNDLQLVDWIALEKINLVNIFVSREDLSAMQLI